MNQPRLQAPPLTPARPQAHQRHWLGGGATLCLALWLAGCASPPASPSQPSQPSQGAEVPYNSLRNDVALVALSLLDAPYAWGGRGPATGFDCSGLVAHVFREGGGIQLKGTSAELGRQSRPIARHLLLPGDLVFFNTLGRRHSHVGVYVGDGRFVHASNPRTGVRIDVLSNRYYAQRFEGAHRLLD
ncbi:C40 family peptidase [Limnohabitans sp.]|uniref:C40 family peptidase n=1 Tax=Limnohabitans sp. TaxID=1907725 RepID=UPI0037BFE863